MTGKLYRHRPLPANPPAAQHAVAIVKHRRLPGRDRLLRLVQPHARGVLVAEGHGRGRAGVGVADFHGRIEGEPALSLVEWVARLVPDRMADFKFLREQILRVADDHAARLRVDIDDVERARRAAGQAFALADGEHFDPLMLAEPVARLVVDAAGMKFLFPHVRFQERLVIVPRHEADFLAVHLVRDLQADLPRDVADFRLRHFAERAERAQQLLLPQAEQKIRLVLARVAPLAQHGMGIRAVPVVLNDGVMAGGDIFRPERARLFPQVAEFQFLIAHHARVRRASRLVFARKIIDDQLPERIRLVHHVMRNPQRMRHAARIGDRAGPAAFVLRARDAILRPDLHRHAHDIVAPLLEQVRGHAGIDAAAHSEDDPGFCFRHWEG